MKILGLVLLLQGICNSAFADFYQGIRQMGMGGAAIAVVNDETSLLLNPNGLGRLREPYVTILDPEVTANKSSLSPVSSLAFDAIDVQKVYDKLTDHLDERYFVRAQFFPSYVSKNYGAGLLMRYDITATRSSTTQFLDLNYISDWGAVAGYNHSFYGGVLKLGATGKLIDRVQSKGIIDPSVQGLDLKNIAVEGMGLGADVGLSLTSPTDWLPTLSLLAKDIGDTSFTMSKGTRSYPTTTQPEKIPMELDVAVALFPIWSKYSRGTFTVEYDNVLVNNGVSTNKKLHFGAEVNLADRLFLRAGLNKGYVTTGLEWASTFFQIQLAYYGEEIGTGSTSIKDDRYAIKTVFRF